MPRRKRSRKDRPAEARRAAFVEAYTTPGPTFFKGRDSAIAAGHAPKSAHVTASRLLKDAKIQAAIAEKFRPAVEAARVSRETLIRRALQIADSWQDSNGKIRWRPTGAEVRALELAARIAELVKDSGGSGTGVVAVQVNVYGEFGASRRAAPPGREIGPG